MGEQLVGIVGEGSKLAIIAICTLTSVQNKSYATHLQFAYKLAKDNPDYQFILYTPYRMSIANFRASAAKAALDSEADYLMFIDDDAVLYQHPSIFKELKDKIDDDPNKHIIMPVVYVRGYPFHPMFFKWVEGGIQDGKGLTFYDEFKEKPVDEKKLLEVAAIGCHTCLIKVEVLKNLTEPFFMTGQYFTEDVFFCMKCHDQIKNIGIYVATDISIGHLLDPLWVDDGNVVILKKLYEDLKLVDTFNFEDFYKQSACLKEQLSEVSEDFEL